MNRAALPIALLLFGCRPATAAPPGALATAPTAPAAPPAAAAMPAPAASAEEPAGPGRGFPASGPWVSFYGSGRGVDLDRVAATFRVINLDADPDAGNFTDEQLRRLKAGGRNRVISYLNVGSCEAYRSYYKKDPPGQRSCLGSGALTSRYDGYPDERWADLSNLAYRRLIVEHVAARLHARGVDGFFLDNLEVVEHGDKERNGPCGPACAQGGLDLVYELRQRFPRSLIVMQNATSDVTRLGKSHGAPLPSLLDGVSRESLYKYEGDFLDEMRRWQRMDLRPGGRPFWIAAEEYVGACAPRRRAARDALVRRAAADRVELYVTDESGRQRAPCYW